MLVTLEDRVAGKGYDHHEYEDEMRAAIERWAEYIERLVTQPGTKRLRG
jgi:hypothetical protein